MIHKTRIKRPEQAVLVLCGLLILAVMTFLFWSSNQKLVSYEQCARAKGSTILTTYPPICMTHDGQRFTGPGHVTSPNKLKVHEWNLALPLNDSIADAYYTFDAKEDQIYLTTTQLESLRSQLDGCTSGLHGVYYRHDGDKLVEHSPIETLCLPASTSGTEQIKQIASQLRTAAKSAEKSN